MKRLCSIILAMTMALMVTPEPQPEPPMTFDGFTAQNFIVPIPKDFKRPPPPEMPELVTTFKSELDALMDDVPILCTDMVLDDCFKVFITGYCSCVQCCGWETGMTASGEYVHRADDFNRIREPSSCAIDLNHFSFGDVFYIPSEDRTYIAEDTGAFRGMWLDLYQYSHDDVRAFNTRYEYVYAVHFESHLEPANKYDIQKYIHKEMNNNAI